MAQNSQQFNLGHQGGAGNQNGQPNQKNDKAQSNLSGKAQSDASREQTDKGKGGSDLTRRNKSSKGGSSFFGLRSSQPTTMPAEISESPKGESSMLAKVIERLERDLAGERLNRERVERTADNLQRHIDTTEILLGPQASDDKIVEKFTVLMSNIRTWSLKFIGDAPNHLVIEPNQERLDMYYQVNIQCRTQEGLQMILQDNRRRRLFARGLVAYIISSTIFRSHDWHTPPLPILEPKDWHSYPRQDLWLEEPLREFVYRLERKLDKPSDQIGVRELNNWRALTIELLTRARGEETTLPKDTSTYLTDLEVFVKNLMAPWAASGTGDTQDSFENLSDILKEAVELSHYLRRQRPCWSVYFPRMPIPSQADIDQGNIKPHSYDTGIMLDHRLDDVKVRSAEARNWTVEFVVAPGLCKRGTLEGDQFDRKSIVKKVEVIVWRDETK